MGVQTEAQKWHRNDMGPLFYHLGPQEVPKTLPIAPQSSFFDDFDTFRHHLCLILDNLLSGFCEVPSKLVFGHNLHYMAPFGIPRTGFCMFFQPASVAFSCLGADF